MIDYYHCEACDRLSDELVRLRIELDKALVVLKNLRSCQHSAPLVDGDSEHWWQAAVDEADAFLENYYEK